MHSISFQPAILARNFFLHRVPASCWAATCRFVFAALVMTTVAGCSKEDTTSATQSNRSAASITPKLLDFVPADAVVVNTLDMSSAEFQQLKAGPYGSILAKVQQGPFASLPQSSDTTAGATAAKVIRAASNAGLLPSLTQSSPELVQEYVGFLEPVDSVLATNPLGLHAAYYFEAAPGVDLTAQLDRFETALQKEGLSAQKSTQGDRRMLRVQLRFNTDDGDATPTEMQLFAFASKRNLAIASSETLAQRLFNPSSADSFTKSRKFGAISAFLPEHESKSFGFSYFDLRGLAKAAAAHAPEEERVKLLSGLEALPVEHVVGQFTMEGAPVLRYAAPYSAKNEEQKKVLASLQLAKEPVVFNSGPANSIFLLSIDGAVLQQLKDSALIENQGAETVKDLATLDGITGLGLGLANPTGTSPFPEIFLLGKIAEGAAVTKAVKDMAQRLTASSGMPLTPWQQKSIGGVSVDYMLSPLGIGLYVGAIGQIAFVASSENMVTAIIDATSNKSPSLGMTHKEVMASAVLASHLNFGRLYDLLMSLQGTLAMFTGGQGFDASGYAGLKELGSLSAVVSADGKALRMEARLRQEPQS